LASPSGTRSSSRGLHEFRRQPVSVAGVQGLALLEDVQQVQRRNQVVTTLAQVFDDPALSCEMTFALLKVSLGLCEVLA
jgi:hypothetical protein